MLVPEENAKQNLDEAYTQKYQKYVASSYVYKLIYFDNAFRKSFKSYLGENAVHNLINSMIV